MGNATSSSNSEEVEATSNSPILSNQTQSIFLLPTSRSNPSSNDPGTNANTNTNINTTTNTKTSTSLSNSKFNSDEVDTGPLNLTPTSIHGITFDADPIVISPLSYSQSNFVHSPTNSFSSTNTSSSSITPSKTSHSNTLNSISTSPFSSSNESPTSLLSSSNSNSQKPLMSIAIPNFYSTSPLSPSVFTPNWVASLKHPSLTTTHSYPSLPPSPSSSSLPFNRTKPTSTSETNQLHSKMLTDSSDISMTTLPSQPISIPSLKSTPTPSISYTHSPSSCPPSLNSPWSNENTTPFLDPSNPTSNGILDPLLPSFPLFSSSNTYLVQSLLSPTPPCFSNVMPSSSSSTSSATTSTSSFPLPDSLSLKTSFKLIDGDPDTTSLPDPSNLTEQLLSNFSSLATTITATSSECIETLICFPSPTLLPFDLFVVGSWNHWQHKFKLTYQSKLQVYQLTLPLIPGTTYVYLFIYENKYLCHPNLPMFSQSLHILHLPEKYAQLQSTWNLDPPSLPSHLSKSLFHIPPSTSSTSSIAFIDSISNSVDQLSLPTHVVLNHIYTCKPETSASDLMALGMTCRYRSKYITTVLYKPIKES